MGTFEQPSHLCSTPLFFPFFIEIGLELIRDADVVGAEAIEMEGESTEGADAGETENAPGLLSTEDDKERLARERVVAGEGLQSN
jgi:hypothetical protein